MKKAQVSIEFIGVTTFMFAIFILFMGIFAVRMGNIKEEANWQRLKDVSEIVEAELEIASSVEDGYSRSFSLPQRIEGKEYEMNLYAYDGVTITATTMYIRYINFSMGTNYSVRLPNNVRGNIYIGENNITKSNGTVCVNVC